MYFLFFFLLFIIDFLKYISTEHINDSKLKISKVYFNLLCLATR